MASIEYESVSPEVWNLRHVLESYIAGEAIYREAVKIQREDLAVSMDATECGLALLVLCRLACGLKAWDRFERPTLLTVGRHHISITPGRHGENVSIEPIGKGATNA